MVTRKNHMSPVIDQQNPPGSHKSATRGKKREKGTRRQSGSPLVIEMVPQPPSRYRFLPDPECEHGHRTAIDSLNRKSEQVAFLPESDHVKQR